MKTNYEAYMLRIAVSANNYNRQRASAYIKYHLDELSTAKYRSEG